MAVSVPQNLVLAAALSYAALGLPVFPCKLDKTPYLKDWPNAASTDAKQVREWWTRWPEASIGMVTGYRSGRVVLDVDQRHGGAKSLAVLEEQYRPLPETLEVETGGGGRHLHFQLRGLDIRNSAGVLAPGIDVRGVGGFVILPPSAHLSGKHYAWANHNPVIDLPVWLEKKLIELKSSPPASSNLGTPPAKIPAGQRNRWLVSRAGEYRRKGDDPKTIYRKLVVDYQTRCEQSPPVEDKELSAIAKWVERFAPEPETTGPPKADIPSEPISELEPDSATDTAIIGAGREDTSNSQRFIAAYADAVKFWHGRNRWLLWSGTHWDEDALATVVELAKETAKNIFIEAASLPVAEAKMTARWAERSLNRDKINSMLALSQSHPKVATTTEKWDRDPYALNFLNGTVDLRTGILRPHCREDFITKLARCSYVPDLVGPRWLRFIEQTFGPLAQWLQKAIGYSFSGITTEKVAFLLWGVTDTGKSTFLSTVREVFADYSAGLQIDTLMWSRKNEDNNSLSDLASLRGARFVVTSETEEGQRLKESALKRIIQGGGPLIKARRLYENPIEFPETFKLWLDCNHQPTIRGVDDSIWGRLAVIPCVRRVSDAEKDPQLRDKLLHEAEAIASWTVAGAVRWHKEGLGRPDLVVETRQAWRERMDSIGQFLSECCDQEPDGFTRANELYEAFAAWSKKQGYEYVMTSTAFGLRLTERGLKKDRDTKGNIYRGIKLNGGFF